MHFLVLAALVVTVLPGAALANAPNNESATYDWILLGPPDFPANVGMAPNGGTATLTGSGTFSVHPKSATSGGRSSASSRTTGTFPGQSRRAKAQHPRVINFNQVVSGANIYFKQP